MSRIIAVANQKGGVGKTTTAVNLAAALALQNRPTLLVDCDPQSNSTRALGFAEDNERPSLYDALVEDLKPADVVVPVPDIAELKLLPADRNLTGAELELIDADAREFRLKRYLEQVRDGYRYVIIDCPPSLGLLTLNALAAADELLIPVQCEYLALEGISQLMDTIERVRAAVNPDLDIAGILMTMYDERVNLAKQVVDEVRGVFGEQVFLTVIPRNVRLGEAPSFGQPIFLYEMRSKGAEAYLALAQEILHDETESVGQGTQQLDSDRAGEGTVADDAGEGGRGTAGDRPGPDRAEPAST